MSVEEFFDFVLNLTFLHHYFQILSECLKRHGISVKLTVHCITTDQEARALWASQTTVVNLLLPDNVNGDF